MSDIVERLRSTEFASATDGLRSPVIWVKGTVAREAADEIEKLRARAVKWAGIAGTLIAERDQLIGVLQIAVERSGDMETPPAWVDGACSLLNRGFLKVDRTALGEKDDAKV